MLSGTQVEEMRNALMAAYSKSTLREMMRLRLDRDLEDLVNLDESMSTIAFNLIMAAEWEGWDHQLIREAYRYQPGNQAMLRVYEKYGMAPTLNLQKAGAAVAPAAGPPNESGLERLVREEIPFYDIATWSQRMAELQLRVCRVELGGDGIGTGFLVGPEVVLTACHVMSPVLEGDCLENEIICRFDYMVLPDGSTSAGREVKLHADKGILLYSPMHPDEDTLHPETAAPTPDQLDFALLRLSRPLGSQPPPGNAAGKRGWEILPDIPVRLEVNEGLIIVQHPKDAPLKLAIDLQAVIGYNSSKNRVKYRTNTEGGSSGSPVYDTGWKLAGLHHLGDPAEEPRKPQYNQAVVPMSRIREFIVAHGLGHYLSDGQALPLFEAGALAKQLQALDAPANAMAKNGDPLQPYREAAAVLAAFDPPALQPAYKSTASPLELLPELEPTPSLPDRTGAWTLSTAARRRILRSMDSPAKLKEALAANPNRPDVPLQRMLDAAILGKPLDLSALSVEELAALSAVSEWLSHVFPALPGAAAIRVVQQRTEMDAALQKLAGDSFTGRTGELDDLAKFTANPHTLTFVSGLGGMGKSSLLARHLQQLKKLGVGYVRVDLDHPIVEPTEPISLLLVAVDQLAVLDVLSPREANNFREEWSQRAQSVDGAGLESSYDPATEARDRFAEMLDTRSSSSDKAIPFIVDTFEEAQHLGPEVAANLLYYLAQLAARSTRLRVIVSGRLLPESEPAWVTFHSLPLDELPEDDRIALLRRLLSKFTGKNPLNDDILREVATELGGNPLTLRLAARLLAEEDLEFLHDVTDEGRGLAEVIRAGALQGRLYARILGHIRDKEARKAAVPGLMVRCITPSVIREVLAGPCGFPADEETAKRLFNAFGKEVTLLEWDGADGSLKHRTDVRRVMLASIPLTEDPVRLHDIDVNAVKYWSKQAGPKARAEELYHRLRLDQEPAELEKYWDPTARPHLQSALTELERARARHWLADKLDVTLAEDEREAASQEVWESQAARMAHRSLTQRAPVAALASLRSRSTRRPGSPLHALEVRALLLLDRTQEALTLAKTAAQTAEHERSWETSGDLYLLAALIEERLGNLESASGLCKRAETVAELLEETASDPVPKLSALTRNLRIERKREISQNSDNLLALVSWEKPGKAVALLEDGVRQQIGKTQRAHFARHPALLREVAAEIGHIPQRDCLVTLQQAYDILGTETLAETSREELVKFVELSKVVSATRLTLASGGDLSELRKLAHQGLEKFLFPRGAPGPSSEQAQRWLTLQLRRSVDRLLYQEYDPAHAGKPRVLSAEPSSKVADSTPTPAVTLPQSALPELEKLLEKKFTLNTLRLVSRFYLSEDLNASNKKDLATLLINTAQKRGTMSQLLNGLTASLSQTGEEPLSKAPARSSRTLANTQAKLNNLKNLLGRSDD